MLVTGATVVERAAIEDSGGDRLESIVEGLRTAVCRGSLGDGGDEGVPGPPRPLGGGGRGGFARRPPGQLVGRYLGADAGLQGRAFMA